MSPLCSFGSLVKLPEGRVSWPWLYLGWEAWVARAQRGGWTCGGLSRKTALMDPCAFCLLPVAAGAWGSSSCPCWCDGRPQGWEMQVETWLHLPSSEFTLWVGMKFKPPWAPRPSVSSHQLAPPRAGRGRGPGCRVPTLLVHSLSALQELQLDSDPGVWRAALETLNILDTCSQQRLWASPEGIS